MEGPQDWGRIVMSPEHVGEAKDFGVRSGKRNIRTVLRRAVSFVLGGSLAFLLNQSVRVPRGAHRGHLGWICDMLAGRANIIIVQVC